MLNDSQLPLLKTLNTEEVKLFQALSDDWNLTLQEKRQLLEIHIDLKMWKERSLFVRWQESLNKVMIQYASSPKKILKKKTIMILITEWLKIKESPKNYAQKPQIMHSKQKQMGMKDSGDKIFGDCPVASEKTICCNLKTIDVVQNCALGCTYCSIQTFYNDEKILFEENLGEKLSKLSATLNPNQLYHYGTGQSSDSLLWGNRQQILTHLVHFAHHNPNVLLELKTKTKNISDLLELHPSKNLVCTWTMNPQIVIDNEEHLTASLEERIMAARKVADQGLKVGFHFHPIVYFENWQSEYQKIVDKLLQTFTPEEIVFISMGTVTFIKPVIKQIRESHSWLHSKILQMPLEEVCGRYSYPANLKKELFKTINNFFAPWNNKVFFYLCMEPAEFWHSTFNFCYSSNAEFERAMLTQALKKAL